MFRLTNAAIITEKKVVASKKDKRELLYNILFSSQQENCLRWSIHPMPQENFAITHPETSEHYFVCLDLLPFICYNSSLIKLGAGACPFASAREQSKVDLFYLCVIIIHHSLKKD